MHTRPLTTFYKWLYNISFLRYALFAVIVLYTLFLQMALQYLLSLVFIVVIVLVTLFLQMALQYLLSLVCIVSCYSVLYVTFTYSFTISSISGTCLHCLL